ncbi:MAG TPA: trypsin-like peptidase domain-containing protein [Bacillota bacterium]|nr:trypsin-like peptidase domain-containing protein [Bacillota bacterium]HOR84994.1 trypsin-like peptidase domain-containing protein [Bacillota bacterium]HPL52892.1 trypsin-like peptidase domain-containing protein [Bacillota bacterium]
MSDFFDERNDDIEIDNSFYREVIERKPGMSSRRFVALVLIAGLAIGTIFGYGIDNFLPSRGNNTNSVYAAGVENTKIVFDKSVSPVVPIAKKVSPSIVAISLKTRARDFFGRVYEGQGTGSGIIIDNQGHIVTNNHVVDGANDIVVILNDGKELEATLVGRDSQTDLAVLKVDPANLMAAELGDSSKLEVGELAVAIGSPMGTEYAGSVTAGIISGLNRKVSVGDNSIKLIQTDAAINPGNSGGALVNSEGQVIGINTIKFADTKVEGMGFAIPINEAKPIIESLISNKKISRPYLGIVGQTITKEEAEKYELPQGVYIREVVPFSGAERAGIRAGDIITKLDGKKVLTVEELSDTIKKHKVGDVVQVEIYDKQDKYNTISVKLRESSD